MRAPRIAEREVDFLERLGRGETTQEIAEAWHMELTSIWTVAERLRKKLGAKTNEHAVFLACQAGILDGRQQRHGDRPGFRAHERRGEEPCEACKTGEAAYRAEMRRKRRQEPAGAPESASEAARDVRGAERAAQGRTEPRGEAAA